MKNAVEEAGGDSSCFELNEYGKHNHQNLINMEDGRSMRRDGQYSYDHAALRFVSDAIKLQEVRRWVQFWLCVEVRTRLRYHEMLILRNIGLEFRSFQLTFRRKVLGFAFFRPFFNSYIDQLGWP